MKTLPAKEAKDRFGDLLDTAQREPVTIKRHGRSVALLLSIADYERLERIEDAWWAARAQRAAKDGFVGAQASAELLAELLDAED